MLNIGFTGLYSSKNKKNGNIKDIRIYRHDHINTAYFLLLHCALKKINNNSECVHQYHDIQYGNRQERIDQNLNKINFASVKQNKKIENEDKQLKNIENSNITYNYKYSIPINNNYHHDGLLSLSKTYYFVLNYNKDFDNKKINI